MAAEYQPFDLPPPCRSGSNRYPLWQLLRANHEIILNMSN
jgi:hypothetical protein